MLFWGCTFHGLPRFSHDDRCSWRIVKLKSLSADFYHNLCQEWLSFQSTMFSFRKLMLRWWRSRPARPPSWSVQLHSKAPDDAWPYVAILRRPNSSSVLRCNSGRHRLVRVFHILSRILVGVSWLSPDCISFKTPLDRSFLAGTTAPNSTGGGQVRNGLPTSEIWHCTEWSPAF